MDKLRGRSARVSLGILAAGNVLLLIVQTYRAKGEFFGVLLHPTYWVLVVLATIITIANITTPSPRRTKAGHIRYVMLRFIEALTVILAHGLAYFLVSLSANIEIFLGFTGPNPTVWKTISTAILFSAFFGVVYFYPTAMLIASFKRRGIFNKAA